MAVFLRAIFVTIVEIFIKILYPRGGGREKCFFVSGLKPDFICFFLKNGVCDRLMRCERGGAADLGGCAVFYASQNFAN